MASREPLALGLEALGLTPLLRAAGRGWRGALVLTYHRIGDADACPYDRGLFSATQARLDEQMAYLRRHFDIVDTAEGLRAAYGRRGRAVAVTFDDGYRDNYDLALPVLREHRIPATFFVATGFVDRPRVSWWDELAWIVRRTNHPQLRLSDGAGA
ncbi:MAG: polysaccharide deacetylase, partial [Solirubrobacterales bacterium]|nr:polysaccharide deacetylase [Solirubrobacterales bacterium]